MTNLLLLLGGLVGLWIGTELVIRGALVIAHRFGLSDEIVGLSILALGSDLPELVITTNASIHSLGATDASGIVIGSAVGSAMGQFGLALGIAGLVAYLTLPRRYILRHGAALTGGIVILVLLGLDGTLTRVDGIVLALLYGVYFVALFERRPAPAGIAVPRRAVLLRGPAAVVVGALLLGANSELVVQSASGLATTLGVAELTVAIFVIGMGSSLPELSISLIALKKQRGGLSVGNLVGSNALDTLLVPGLGAMISPVVVDRSVLWFDLPALLLLTTLALVFFARRRGLQRREALALLTVYALYLFFRVSIV